MKKHLYLLAALITIASLVLAACGGTATQTPQQTAAPEVAEPAEATEPPAEATEPAAAEPPAAAGDRVQIRWFVGLGTGTGDEQQDIQQQVVDEFNASQDGIELVLEVVPYDSARDALSTQIASGNGPDIIGPVGWSGSNAFYGQWLDLAPYVEQTNYDTSVFNEELVKFYNTEEGQVGLPFAVFPAAVFYQKEMFDEAGLNYPPAAYGENYVMPDGSEVEWSYETLTEVARLLTVDVNGVNATEDGFDPDNIVQYGYYPQYQELPHVGAFWGADKLVEEDGVTARIPEHWKASWQWWFDGIWGEQPFSPNQAVITSPDFGADNPFNGGRVAMAITHMWYTCCILDAGENWDLGALPSYNGEVHGRVDADTYRIWKGTPNPEEAFEVVTYLIGPGSLKLLETYGGMPARTADQDAFFATKAEQFPWVENWDVMREGLNYPDVPSAEGYMPNWNEAWDRLVTFASLLRTDGTIDFEAEVESLRQDLQAIFERAG